MAKQLFKRVDALRRPFGPSGQLVNRNIRGGMTVSKAVLSDPDRLQNFRERPWASKLVQLAEQAVFVDQVPYARWLCQGGKASWNVQ